MSEVQRITNATKEKDPRKVEAGKRLGAISKAARENKARQRAESEPTEDTREEGYSMITVITGVGVLSGLACLYFAYMQAGQESGGVRNTVERRQCSTEKSSKSKHGR